MAVVSADHADESYNVENYIPSFSSKSGAASPERVVRYFSPEEVERHNAENGADGSGGLSASFSYWACVDGFVVDSTDFVNKHPGGRRKLLATNDPSAGDTGRPFAFSFSRGRNAHFPETARIFQEGVKRFLDGGSAEVVFPAAYKRQSGGKLVILGRLRKG